MSCSTRRGDLHDDHGTECESPEKPTMSRLATANNAVEVDGPLTAADFELLGVLGVGSFGVVRLAKHATTGAPVALKVLAKETIVVTRRQQHVMRERRVHADLHHPFVASLFGAFQDRDRVYLALEFLPGGELWSVVYGDGCSDDDDDNNTDDCESTSDSSAKEEEVRPISPIKRPCSGRALPSAHVLDAAGARMALLDPKWGGLREQPAAFYLGCIASALHYLHKSGVLYRDLKLENVVLDAAGYAKLIDFGFATPFSISETSDADSSDSTRRSTLCGSADYMAPEVLLRSTRHDPRVDIWSLGIVLYEMLVGRTPFYHDNPRELSRRVIHDPVAFPDGFELAHPLACDLMIKLLAKNPADRIQTVDDVRRHPFFAANLGFDVTSSGAWDELERRELPPPFAPKLNGPFDASFFRQFDADELRELEDEVLPYEDDDDTFDGF